MGTQRISGIAKAFDTKGMGHGYYDDDFYKYPAKSEVHPIVSELNYKKKENNRKNILGCLACIYWMLVG